MHRNRLFTVITVASLAFAVIGVGSAQAGGKGRVTRVLAKAKNSISRMVLRPAVRLRVKGTQGLQRKWAVPKEKRKFDMAHLVKVEAIRAEHATRQIR